MLALAIFAVTLVLGLWVAFGRQIPSRYPVEAIDPPRSAIKDLLVFRAAFPILMSAWPCLAWRHPLYRQQSLQQHRHGAGRQTGVVRQGRALQSALGQGQQDAAPAGAGPHGF